MSHCGNCYIDLQLFEEEYCNICKKNYCSSCSNHYSMIPHQKVTYRAFSSPPRIEKTIECPECNNKLKQIGSVSDHNYETAEYLCKPCKVGITVRYLK